MIAPSSAAAAGRTHLTPREQKKVDRAASLSSCAAVLARPLLAGVAVHASAAAVSQAIVEQDSEMRQLLDNIRSRHYRYPVAVQVYNKHDMARLRFIPKALMGLRLGILVPELDMRMLRLEPQE